MFECKKKSQLECCDFSNAWILRLRLRFAQDDKIARGFAPLLSSN